jgi:hypothetical protein
VRELPNTAERLYVIVRGDLPVGLACAQAIHAARIWRTNVEPTVVVLRCKRERFPEALEWAGLRDSAVWREPDLADEPTALVVGEKPPRRFGDLLQ